ncbi:aldehyde dehydrogenase family protein [Cupriavidus basilensis]
MAAETGASAMWAGFNVHLAAAGLLEAARADHADPAARSFRPTCRAAWPWACASRAGVVLGMAPWNAPVILAVRAIALPLACGNTVVLKGSEICPATHGLIIEAMQEAGLPKGVVNFVTNAPADAGELVEAMIAHPGRAPRELHRFHAGGQASSPQAAPGI